MEMPINTKRCKMCGVVKSLDDFHRKSSAKDGKQTTCKPCAISTSVRSQNANHEDRLAYIRQWQLDNEDKQAHTRYKYKLKKRSMTFDDYDNMLAEQGGVCKICGCEDPAQHKRKVNFFSVDHCHKTGNVRGLLCDACNNGLARFKDDPSILRRAAEYLEPD